MRVTDNNILFSRNFPFSEKEMVFTIKNPKINFQL